MSTERWKITLLGGMRIRRSGTTVEHWPRRKVASLLAYLVCFPERTHTRQDLMDRWWDGGETENPANSLRVALSVLRHLLEAEGVKGSVLQTQGGTVRLHPNAYECDVDLFSQTLQGSEKNLESAETLLAFDRALELYKGPLMSGHSEDWIVSERERLAQFYIKGVRQRLARDMSVGWLDAGIDLALKATGHEPLNEDLRADLFYLYAHQGRQKSIIDSYDAFRKCLRKELNAEPTPAMQARVDEALAIAGSESKRLERVATGFPAAPSHTSDHPSAIPVLLANLPAPTTRFFGREEELNRATALIMAPLPRLLTLTGIGGIGKTHLALETARRLEAHFGGRCCFVALNELVGAQQLPLFLCNALRLDPTFRSDPLEQIVHALSQQPALLLLDNFDTLLQSDSEARESVAIVRTLMERVPTLKILATSRQPLAIPGEAEFIVETLPLPSMTLSPEAQLTFASMQLFLDRAHTVRENFRISPASLSAVLSLCQKLDGLPLAIELAAGWAGTLTPAQMLTCMDRHFELLQGGQARVEARHRALSVVFEESYHLLPATVQRLFTRLSVFRGGWTLEAAEAICGDEEGPSVLAGLELLRQRSFVVVTEIEDAMRYRFLETVRDYAEEQLGEERAVLVARHIAYFTEVAEQAAQRLFGRDQRETLNHLEVEHDNLRAALDHTLQAGQVEEHLRLVSPIARFWAKRCYLREGSDRLARACALEAKMSPAFVSALRWHGVLLDHQGKFDTALHCYRKALIMAHRIDDISGTAWSFYSLGSYHLSRCSYAKANRALQIALCRFQQVGDASGTANAIHSQASVAMAQGHLMEAHNLYCKSYAYRQEADDLQGMAVSLHNLGAIRVELGDLEGGSRYLEQARDHYHALGHPAFEAVSQVALSTVRMRQGAYKEARCLLETALETLNRMDAQLHEGIARSTLGYLCVLEGRFAEAGVQLQESVRLLLITKNQSRIADAIDSCAQLAAALNHPYQAVQWFAASEGLRQAIDVPVPSHCREPRAKQIAELRNLLGAEAFHLVWAEGVKRSLAEVSQEILEGVPMQNLVFSQGRI